MWKEEILQRVHDRWSENKTAYPGGYGIFYGPVHHQPPLMLIGENPGGVASSFAGKDFIALEKTRWDLPAMEYLEYKGDTSYPLARKTVRLFEKAGYPELLGKSVKTNTCFFRTRRSADVRKEDWT